MIKPTEDDIGRAVVYTGNRYPGGKPEEGVITSFTSYAVFVRYGSDRTSKATIRQDLEWVNSTVSRAMTDSLSDYLVEQIGQTLIGGRRDKGKHKLVLRVIGWPSDVREEIER